MNMATVIFAPNVENPQLKMGPIPFTICSCLSEILMELLLLHYISAGNIVFSTQQHVFGCCYMNVALSEGQKPTILLYVHPGSLYGYYTGMYSM